MWQGFLDCRLKVKRASLGSIPIREVPVPVRTFPEQEVIITQRSRHSGTCWRPATIIALQQKRLFICTVGPVFCERDYWANCGHTQRSGRLPRAAGKQCWKENSLRCDSQISIITVRGYKRGPGPLCVGSSLTALSSIIYP